MSESKKERLTEIESLREEVQKLREIGLIYQQTLQELKIKEKAIASSVNAIAFFDLEGNLIYANEGFTRMWGYGSELDILGKHVSDFWQGEAGIGDVMKNVRDTGNWFGELNAKKRDGSRFDAQLVASVVRDDSGNPTCIMASVIDVTDRKESEEKWHSLVQNAPNIIMIIDRDGTISFINRTVPGFTAENTVGTKVYDYIEPSFHDVVRETTEQVFRTKKPGKYEIEGDGPDGNRAWYETRIGPIMKEEQVVGATLVVSDITVRRRAEEALRESEEKFRTIYDHAMDGILLAETESKKLVDCNDMMSNKLGYSREEIRQLSVKDIHPEGDLKRVEDVFEKQARGQIILAKDIPMLRKDGSVFYAEVNSGPVTIEGKHCLMGLFHDVTERKEMEEALRRSEQKFRLITENTSDLIAIMSLDGAYKYLSPSHSQLGYQPEELIGRSGMDMIHPEDKKRLTPVLARYSLERIREIVSRRKEAYVYEHVEFRFPDKKGEWHDMESTANLMKSLSGEGYDILMISRDVTKRKKAEHELSEQRKLLDKTNKELKWKVEELEAAISHIKRLEGLVPICVNCKKMRTEGGDPKDPKAWIPLEKYISDRTDASLTHGLCPECIKKLYGDLAQGQGKEK